MADDSDEEFFFYGTPLQDQEETGGVRKLGGAPQDAGATRALPVHQQEATDEQGRRRFHGAFTGGFSAGYFNTVGSKEGFEPATFKSSRGERASLQQQKVEDFLDADEKEEAEQTSVHVAADFDTFSSRAAQQARASAQAAADARPSLIPGAVLGDLVTPVADSVGMRLLQKMGWRPGKGIASAQVDAAGLRGSKWGSVAGVLIENTPLYVLDPKEDLHGLGYDAFRDAEEFRTAKKHRQAAAGGGSGARQQPGAKRQRGIAFGTGALEEQDTLGYMEDYVDDESARPGAMPRGAKRDVFAFEEFSDSDDDDRFNPKRLKQGQLKLTAAPGTEQLLLTSREERTKHGSFLPGFKAAEGVMEFPTYPPPAVPEGWVAKHTFSSPQGVVAPGAGSLPPPPPPPEAPPPADPKLRQDIDSLAAQVAKSGVVAEQLAAKQAAQGGGKFSFLLPGGEGRAYYDWRVHKMRTALAAAAAAVSATGRSLAGAPQQHQPQPQQRLGLSPEERAAILGEQMLPASSAAQQGGGAPAGAAQAAAAPPPQLLPAGVRAVDVASVAETDRQRLAASLEGAFVKGSQQDFTRESQQQQEAAAGLWRPAPKLTPAQEEQRAKLPPAARAFLSDMAGRFAGGSSQETAVLQPEASGLLRTPAAAGAEPAAPAPEAPESRLPTRSFEDWRPSPLLCKRFNVPDPYKGRKAPQQMSKYKTDYLALPDTAAAFAAGGIPKRLPGQAPAEAQLLLQLPPPPAGPVPVGAGGGLLGGLQLPPPPAGLAPSGAGGARPGGMQMQMPLPPPPPLPTAAAAASPAGDVAAMAADIMGELEAEFAVPASAAAAHQLPPLPPGPPPPDVDAEPVGEEAVAAAGEKPLDLFKAIFEASDSSDDDEEEEQEGDGQQLPPRAAAGGQPADAEAAAGQPAAQKQPAQPQGSQGAAGRVDAVDAVSKAKGLAEAFMRAQQREAGQAAAAPLPAAPSSSGQRPPDPRGGGSGGGGRAAPAAQPASGAQAAVSAEEQRRLEILEALRSLKKKSKKSKHSKGKKDRGKKGKAKAKDKDKARRSKSSKKRRKRSRSSASGSSSSDSENSSGSSG